MQDKLVPERTCQRHEKLQPGSRIKGVAMHSIYKRKTAKNLARLGQMAERFAPSPTKPIALAVKEFRTIVKWSWGWRTFVGAAVAAALVLAVLYLAINVLGYRRWSRPLVVYGTSAIMVLFMSSLVSKLMLEVRAGSGGTVNLRDWIYNEMFATWAGPLNGSLAFALAYVALWLVVAWFLSQRRLSIMV